MVPVTDRRTGQGIREQFIVHRRYDIAKHPSQPQTYCPKGQPLRRPASPNRNMKSALRLRNRLQSKNQDVREPSARSCFRQIAEGKAFALTPPEDSTSSAHAPERELMQEQQPGSLPRLAGLDANVPVKVVVRREATKVAHLTPHTLTRQRKVNDRDARNPAVRFDLNRHGDTSSLIGRRSVEGSSAITRLAASCAMPSRTWLCSA